MSKLTDPVHFFTCRGDSVLTVDHLHKEIDRLNAELDKVKRLNTTLLRRLSLTDDTETAKELDG